MPLPPRDIFLWHLNKSASWTADGYAGCLNNPAIQASSADRRRESLIRSRIFSRAAEKDSSQLASMAMH